MQIGGDVRLDVVRLLTGAEFNHATIGQPARAP